MIFVTNNNEFEHMDSYDGEKFFWGPGEKLPVPEEAAKHMFGYGKPDKAEALVRLGWNWDEEVGISKLRKFVFTKAQIVESEG